MIDLKQILNGIAREEERLAQLTREKSVIETKIESLKKQLAAVQTQYIPKTSSDKISLFMELFKGRNDVFPRLWVSSKTGKKGYSPACANDWISGVCGKTLRPPIKCGACSAQSFLPLTEQVILDHLQGRQVIGVYPMLRDESCWFVAADFDGESWRENVAAFREICRSYDISCVVEVSRSGNGAHVWIFFTEPLPAVTARQMGCFLITETMSRRHELTMKSYDRLFPSQDTLPKGGFGNLIALPLQHELRKQDRTVFLDDNFKSYDDQWEFLASVQRNTPVMIREIAQEAVRQGQVIGLTMISSEDDELSLPWERPTLPSIEKLRQSGLLPSDVCVVSAQRLYVEKRGLPSQLVNCIKRIAAFQNPEFYKKQRLRLSTNLTPRVIRCFEDHGDYISLPRGCIDELSTIFNELGITMRCDDKRVSGEAREFTFNGTLAETQRFASRAILDHDIGIIAAPPGFGKTVVAAHLIAARRCSTLVLVHRKPLLDQWRAQLQLFLGLEKREIGQYGSGRTELTGTLDVAMIQSLARGADLNELVADYEHVIVDECHHIPAVSFERVLNEAKARYVTGLTATPYRRDGHQAIILMQCGQIRFKASPKTAEAQGRLAFRLVPRNTGFQISPAENGQAPIHDIFMALVADDGRTRMIVDDVKQALNNGRTPIVLTERKDHLDRLSACFADSNVHIFVLHGTLSAKKRRETMERLAGVPAGEKRLILATGRYIGEGFDDPRLDTLFLAMPFSWKGTLVQYAGRLHRAYPGKRKVLVYDYVDVNVPVLMRMHQKRLRGFKSMGYALEENRL